jgi:NAD(P)-dependent dehydrogenase (short-subunit alcohol dehydrogenase family)
MRVVFISGATGAAGRAAAARFAAAGDRLALVGTDLDRLTTAATEIGLVEGGWRPVVADLREEAHAQAAVAEAEAHLGPVDVVVHLVGGWAGGTPVVQTERAGVEEMLAQHLWSTLAVVRAVVPGMTARGWGRIVAAVPSSILEPAPKMAAYGIAKAAQDALLRTLAREVAGAGVTVNLLSIRQIDVLHERETDPLPRNAAWTTPDEVAATIFSLCSDEAAAITGARIPLDGRRA